MTTTTERSTRDRQLFLVGEILGLLITTPRTEQKNAMLTLSVEQLVALRDALNAVQRGRF